MINFNVTGSLFSTMAEFQDYFEPPQTKNMDLCCALFYVLSTLRNYSYLRSNLFTKYTGLMAGTSVPTFKEKKRFIDIFIDITVLNDDMQNAITEVFKSERYFIEEVSQKDSDITHGYSCIAEDLVICNIIRRILQENDPKVLEEMMHKFFYGPKGFSVMKEEVCLVPDYTIPLESLICERFGDAQGKVKNRKWNRILSCAKRSEKIVKTIQRYYA